MTKRYILEGRCIRHRGKLVGKVWQDAETQRWHGTIERLHNGEGDTPEAAFRDVVSKRLGFANADVLHQHNRAVRSKRRQQGAFGRQFARKFLNASPMQQVDMLNLLFKGDKS